MYMRKENRRGELCLEKKNVVFESYPGGVAAYRLRISDRGADVCHSPRTEEYTLLQKTIEQAMEGLEFASPTYGDNQQVVQSATWTGTENRNISFSPGAIPRSP